ncbi:GAF domain-containing protein [Tumebacillus sp. ITR2]|uniref:GAF domain-containing protein n=1 Tax=Tumebacillus amylolyticus TaxID=2801339 RepID=A0ABS1J8H9_9BACL|nr:GAF domain-containing protein [Tumebacillus amylolyticus]MBL0386583.1 GAF domain-containing protein [Tumebacillus amylolyticus]
MFETTKISGDKVAFYQELNSQLDHLLEGEPDWIANLANAASLLYLQLETINWSGFYLYREEQLILGPFMGKPACVRIPLGKGVCGTSATNRETIVVPDVHAFPGHIACDAASRSEIVVPILDGDRLIGVLDIDAPVAERFDDEDRKGLETFVSILNKHVDWSKF